MCNNGFGGGNCCWIIILLIIIWCLLRQRQLGRQWLRLWLQQQLRLQSRSLLLRVS